jgi:hypothetical protein
MKTRLGYVSNSSSASFVIAFDPKASKQRMAKIRRMVGKEMEGDSGWATEILHEGKASVQEYLRKRAASVERTIEEHDNPDAFWDSYYTSPEDKAVGIAQHALDLAMLKRALAETDRYDNQRKLMVLQFGDDNELMQDLLFRYEWEENDDDYLDVLYTTDEDVETKYRIRRYFRERDEDDED